MHGSWNSSRGRVFRSDGRVAGGRADWVGDGVGAAGQRGELKIVAVAGDDVERTSRGDIEQRSPGPIAEDVAGEAAADLSCLEDAAEDEAMALVEK